MMRGIFEHDFTGLTTERVVALQASVGPNVLHGRTRMRPFIMLIEKFNNPLLLILACAAAVSFFVGEHTNSIILLVMISISGVVDFINSYRSEKAVEKLISRVTTTATVLRDGVEREVPLQDIVPGDIVYVSAGDVIPADGVVLMAKDFFVNESAISGEAFPVEKEPRTIKEKKEIETQNKCFMGTSVVTGYAILEITYTGKKTEYGKIAERLNAQNAPTDFEVGIRRFSSFIVRVTIVLVVFVFVANAVTGKGILDSFLFALAIAIGLTPELLPVIMTVSLSRGAWHMAKKDVIVKNLSSIQSLGGMDILCTDKTGTLTENHITLIKHVDSFGGDSEPTLLYSYLSSIFHTGVRGSLDEAICAYKKLPLHGFHKVDEVPFDFMRKRDSVVVGEKGEEKTLVITKGAPEDMYHIATHYLYEGKIVPFDDASRTRTHEQFLAYSRDGFRVLAVAIREMKGGARKYAKEDEKEMVLVGYTAFIDPPKATADEAIRELNQYGVEVKILTGDNELLTEKICRDIGLAIKGTVLGSALISMSEEELKEVVEKTTIFARITPDQKERIIIALKRAGHSVGYLGDGINDAPALKAADVGISVNNAVDVAKETADIILIKKSLRVLHEGIYEGRKIFQNTLKYVSMGLSSNFGNMASMTGASALLPFLPMLPTQILLNNFLYDISQLTITTDTVDKEDLVRPLRWNMRFIKQYMMVFGLLSSVFDFSTFGLLYFVFKANMSQFQTGWFLESFATQVFVIYVIRTKRIPFLQSSPSKALFISTFGLVVFAWILPLTPLGALFSFSVLSVKVYCAIAFLLITYLLLAEMLKHWFYKRFSSHI